ncbi:MAG: hydroxymethylglutaryl-CoA lyase [Bacteroidales bacterium]|nr:hydroxymethylglutaryl-CoA lyase [Bacteroidales bacterium]
MESIHITETPRDAMQGWETIISTRDKLEYINMLLTAGFHTVDVGSLVSRRAVPQMADTREVISNLNPGHTNTQLMVVVGNHRGGSEACTFERIHLIGFPYSTSPTFLKRNINSSPEQAWDELNIIHQMAKDSGKKIRVYVSMAFGNPYGDPWSEEQVVVEVERLGKAGFNDIVFSDITGVATVEVISRLCSKLIKEFEQLTLGIHLHVGQMDWEIKVEAAWQAGFRWFEGAIGGHGGCPMTGYELLANLDTLNLLDWCNRKGINHGVDPGILNESKIFSDKIFR